MVKRSQVHLSNSHPNLLRMPSVKPSAQVVNLLWSFFLDYVTASQHLWSYCLEDVIAPRRQLIQNTFTCYDIVCLPQFLLLLSFFIPWMTCGVLVRCSPLRSFAAPCGSPISFSSNWMVPCKHKSSGTQMCVHLAVSFFACKKSSSQGLLGCPAKIHKRLAYGACSSLVFTFCSLTPSWIAAPSQTRSLFESSCCVPSHQWMSLFCEDFHFILHTHIG